MVDCVRVVDAVVVQDNKNLTNSMPFVKRGLVSYWDKEYINEQLERITNHKDKMLCLFLWMTGVRITEAISIKRQDIDFKNHIIRIRWLKSRRYTERMIPVHPGLKPILELYTAALKLEDRVFPYGRIRGYQIVKKWMGGNPHKFRHSFAINWLRQDGRIDVLNRIMGHKSMQATMEYTKIVPADQGQELMKISFS